MNVGIIVILYVLTDFGYLVDKLVKIILMAKLQKGIEDYFRIPVLLKPVGQTPVECVRKMYQIFREGNRCLIIDDRYEPIKSQYSKLLQKRQKNAPQSISFMMNDFVNEWSQFQIIYRCRFCVGIFDSQQNLAEEWAKACKICKEENRKMVGLIILSINNCNVEGIREPSIIIPEKLETAQYCDFLQPWFYAILSPMQDYLCLLIYELQKDDNGFIVFNKIQEKPEPRTLKKKKKGRCLKICGDLCLALHLIRQAYSFYVEAEDILKKVDDYLWALGSNQGKLACFTTDDVIQGIDKQSALETTRVQCLNLSKKIKIPQLQTQNYFKILKIYTKISAIFDQMSRDFLIYVLTNFSSSEKFSIITQLAMLYKQAGMIRKHNYMLYLAARIAIDVKPKLAGIILNQILKSGHVKEWPLVNANVIKLLIDNTTDSKQGRLHLQLIQSCCSVLTESDVEITLQALQRRNFKEITLENSQIFEIIAINCKQSQTKPKLNNLSQQSPVKPSHTGFFMNWRKKQTIYKFQQQEQINFEIKVRNNMHFSLRCSFRLHFSEGSVTDFYSFQLQPKMNKINIKHKFQEVKQLISLQTIEYKMYNFTFKKPCSHFPLIKLQIYEEYPVFSIKVPQIFANEESSLFSFPLKLTRTKSYLKLAKLELTISVYYNIEVGYQETSYHIANLDQEKYVIVLSDYPYEKYPDQQQTQLIRLSPLKTNKKHLKKIECKLEAIRTSNSKYQISTQSTTSCIFERSIWCELVNITSPMQINFNRQDERIIQNEFIVRIAVHKKQDDLTPYRITQSKVPYILSEETSVIVQKVLKKIDRKELNDSPLLIVFEWCNSTREKQCGTISFQVQPHPIMYTSEKHVQFQINSWNKQTKQQLKSPGQLQIHYKISSPISSNLNHSFIVQPQNLPTIKKYIVIGKTKMKQKQKQYKEQDEDIMQNKQASKLKNVVTNLINLKLFYEYKQEYLFGLKFDNGEIYWFPCIFNVVE